MRRRTWPLWIALVLTVAVGVGIIAFPTLYIMPFKPQASRTMQWALAARTMAPTVTAVAVGLSLLWVALLGSRLRRWWTRALALLVLIPVGGGAWFARQNHFEWMFNPLKQPEYVDAAKATFVHNDDIVMAVNIRGASVAYPILQLGYHHIVNDVVSGEPIVATY
jgi:hypothetical protein